MKTTTTLLDDDRARLDIEVPADRLAHDLEHTLQHLAATVRIPGFRTGKVPPRVVLQRLGREEVLDETLREHLMRWYADALEETPLRPVGRPEIDWDGVPPQGEPFRFSATVRLRPGGRLPEPLRLEAPKPEVKVPQDELEAELEALRADASPLRPVADRPAREGDFVELDFSASVNGRPIEGAAASGYHARLGSGRLVPGLDEAVAGMRPGERKQVPIAFPEDYPSSALAGREAVFDVHLRGVSERDLVPLDDAMARAASEFDTLAELRADLEQVLRERMQEEADAVYRGEVLHALGRAVEVDLPEELVAEKVEELLIGLARRFERAGVPIQLWLERAGKTLDDVRADLRPEAVDALRAEIGLAAYAEQEGVTVDDERMAELLREEAAGDEDGERLVQEVLASSTRESLREDLRLRLALDRAVEAATPISYEQAAARDALWTPEKGRTDTPKPEIWTPGQPR